MQQRQRRPIRGVEIVQHQRQRLQLRRVTEERAGRSPDRRKRPHRAEVPPACRGQGAVTAPRAPARRTGWRRPPAPGEGRPRRACRSAPTADPARASRRGAARFPAAAPEDLQSPARRRRRDAVGQAGLPDPRLAHQHQEPAASAGGSFQRCRRLAKLPFPPDQRSPSLRDRRRTRTPTLNPRPRHRRRASPGLPRAPASAASEFGRSPRRGASIFPGQWRSAARRHMLGR